MLQLGDRTSQAIGAWTGGAPHSSPPIHDGFLAPWGIAGYSAIRNSNAGPGCNTRALGPIDTGGEIDEGSSLALDDQIEYGLSGCVAQHYFPTSGVDCELVLRYRCGVPARERTGEQDQGRE